MPRYWGERIAALGFIAFAIYIGNLALEFPAGGGTFPLFAAGAAVFLSLMIILDTIVRRTAASEKPVVISLSYQAFKPAVITVLTIVYVLSIFEVGYFTATLLFLVISTLLIGLRKIGTILLTAVILLPLMYLFFEVFLLANLPQGALI